MDRKDFQDLSRIRLKEASALFRLGLSDGAFYLAGYAVECALKACIAKGTRRHEFPARKKVESSYSHDLASLLKTAGLDKDLEQHGLTDTEFRDNWYYTQEWSEQSRYQKNHAGSAQRLLKAIGDRQHGVISWIKRRW